MNFFLEPSTPTPSQTDLGVSDNEAIDNDKKTKFLPFIVGAAGCGSLLLLGIIFLCVCFKRKRNLDSEGK